jgi:hypothetical protein
MERTLQAGRLRAWAAAFGEAGALAGLPTGMMASR